MHVTIIGGGISGLSTAWFLDKQRTDRDEPLKYTLLEASPRLGGKIWTDHQDGFLIEGGADSFVTQKPAALTLCRALGLGDELLPCNGQQSTVYILRKGRLIPLPKGFRIAAPTQLWSFLNSPILSLPGKLRVGLEPFISPRKSLEDESLAAFIERRLGREMLAGIAGPIMSGIFSTDPERLSMASSFPRFQQLEQEYGSVIRGMVAEKRKHAGSLSNREPPAMFMGLKSGMGSLVHALSERVKGAVYTDCQVTGITRLEHGRFAVDCMRQNDAQTIMSDALILAVPARSSAPLIRTLQPELAEELAAIRYSNTIHAYLGFRAEDLPKGTPPPGFGFVVPPCEGRGIRSCTFSSIKFPGRASEGQVLLRAFLSPELQESHVARPHAEIIDVVKKELNALMGIQATPILEKVYAYPASNPQYEVGHQDRMDRIDGLAATCPGLHFVGSSFRGVGIPDIVADAERVAQQCCAGLTVEPALLPI
ncbi:MAG: oxygen-dependent protoporphyrinogen oxidase [Kiritimatiellia bacterium]|jgi:protoporphyrinogen/coproporphyrinogen III oxidase